MIGGSSAPWQPLPAGAWMFLGKRFKDGRGESREMLDLHGAPPALSRFEVAQENLVTSVAAGVARGLHYQIGESAQAKLVTVVRGKGQFFWIQLGSDDQSPTVHSLVLEADGPGLYTPSDCAHGFLALEPNTQFLLKMSRPVSHADRGEFSFLTAKVADHFLIEPRIDLFSDRDRNAPPWEHRRRA